MTRKPRIVGKLDYEYKKPGQRGQWGQVLPRAFGLSTLSKQKKFISDVRKYIPDDKDLSEIPSSQKRPLASHWTFLAIT